MYQRVEGGVWHYRIKLKTGEWYRLSSRETDFDEAKEIANRTYYTADYKEKNSNQDNKLTISGKYQKYLPYFDNAFSSTIASYSSSYGHI